MRRLFIIITAILSAVSCANLDEIWEELREHEERIEKLETECVRLNRNIEAIQIILEALKENDYITDIVKIMEDEVEVGYSITFAKSGTITIYHGADGADGADGTDGAAPKIGIRKDSDGEYYWTAGDEWLTDESGEKIPAAVPNDPDGKYITPSFRIADGEWYISYDGGNTWQELGKTEGSQIFKDVTYDENYVYLTLNDGTTLSIPRAHSSNVTLSLESTTDYSATFTGSVLKKTVDLMVTVYYSTTESFSIYNYTGKESVNQFDGDKFTLTINGLQNGTKYYYFTEVISDGRTSYSQIASFETGQGSINITDLFSWTVGTCTFATGKTSSSDTNWKYSNAVNISGFTQLRFSHIQTVTTNTTLGYCFYDKDMNHISGQSNAGASYIPVEKTVDVPSGAVYFRCMWINTTSANYVESAHDLSSFYCYGIEETVDLPGWTLQNVSYDPDLWANSTVRKNGLASISDGSSKGRLAYTIPFDIPKSGRVMVTCGPEYEWAFRNGAGENDTDENQYWLSNGDELQIAHSAAGGKMILIIRKNSNVPRTPFQYSQDPATQQTITKQDALASRIKLYFKETYTHEFDTSEWLLADTPSTDPAQWLRATVTENGPGTDGSKTDRLTYNYVYDASVLTQKDVIMVTCGEGYQWGVRSGTTPGTFQQNQYWYNSGTPIRFYQGPNPISIGTASQFMIVFRKVASHDVGFGDNDDLTITKDDIPHINAKVYTSYSSNPVKKYSASGKLTYSDGSPASGISVSDGFNVTQTDAYGNYTLTTSDDTYHIFYSVPEDCEVVTNDYGQPAFFARYDKKKASHDFTLTRRPGGKETSFSLFCLADPQCANSSNRNRLVNETLPDLRAHAASKSGSCYGVTLGDVAYSNNSQNAVPQMPYLRDHFSVTNSGMPVFQVMGNHDNTFFSASSPLQDDETSSTYNLKAQRAFEDVFGPIDYSWNRGDVHIVCMRNIQYKSQTSQSNYVIGFTDSQLEWLRQDLSFVPKDKMVILCVHIPMSEGNLNGSTDNVKKVLDLISEYKEAHVMAGHRHYARNTPDMYKGIYEHTHAAVCGAWWASNLNPDGTPNGYAVYKIEGSTMKNWYHKGVNTGMNSTDYQLRLHRGNMVTGGAKETFAHQHEGDVLLANVFNADSEWEIKVYENGIYSGNMEYMSAKSYIPAKGTPTYIPLDSSQDWWAIGYHVGVKGNSRTNEHIMCATYHMYSYTLKDKNASVRVEATDRFGRTYSTSEITDGQDYTLAK